MDAVTLHGLWDRAAIYLAGTGHHPSRLLVLGTALVALAAVAVPLAAQEPQGRLVPPEVRFQGVSKTGVAVFEVTNPNGVPLPFVSYGNSSLLTTLLAVGLILNVARGGTAGAGKLRVVEGGRSPARKRSKPSRGKSAQSRSGSGGNRRPRRAGDSRRRRASG